MYQSNILRMLEEISSLSELERWASHHRMEQDPLVQARRAALSRAREIRLEAARQQRETLLSSLREKRLETARQQREALLSSLREKRLEAARQQREMLLSSLREKRLEVARHEREALLSSFRERRLRCARERKERKLALFYLENDGDFEEDPTSLPEKASILTESCPRTVKCNTAEGPTPSTSSDYQPGSADLNTSEGPTPSACTEARVSSQQGSGLIIHSDADIGQLIDDILKETIGASSTHVPLPEITVEEVDDILKTLENGELNYSFGVAPCKKRKVQWGGGDKYTYAQPSTSTDSSYSASEIDLSNSVVEPTPSTSTAESSTAETLSSSVLDPMPSTSTAQSTGSTATLEPTPGTSSSEPVPSTSQSSSASEESESNGTPGYQLIKRRERVFAKNKAKDTSYEVKLNPKWEGKKLKNLHEELRDMFNDVLQRARGQLANNDLGRVVIHHEGLDAPIVVPPRPLENLNADTVMSHIENVLTSNQDLSVGSSLKVTVGIIEMPKGGAFRRITNLEEDLIKKTGVGVIRNKDNMCMARAIARSWAKLHKVSNEDFRKITAKQPHADIVDLILEHRKVPHTFYKGMADSKKHGEGDLARAFYNMVHIPNDQECSLLDIPAFEEALDIRILVASARMGNKFIYVGEEVPQRKNVYLYLIETPEGGHFNSILSITGFFGQSYFCPSCLKAYQNRNKHQCEVKCLVCKSQNCQWESPVKCQDCYMTCRSQTCHELHKETQVGPDGKMGKSQCQQWWKCPACKKVFNLNKRDPLDQENPHVCGEWYCFTCKKLVNEGHLCHQRAETRMKPVDKFITFDFECTQDQVAECTLGYEPTSHIQCTACIKDGAQCTKCKKCKNCRKPWCGQNAHQPNFVVAWSTCKECIQNDYIPTATCEACGTRCVTCKKWDKDSKCYQQPPCEGKCGFRQVVFEGECTLKDFGQWLFTPQHKGFTVISHNGRAYDNYPLLEYMLSQSMRPSKLIYQGSKIMYMHVGRGLNMTILDSLNFLPMKLSKLPKTFGLTELKKGWFPHFFNRRENENYVGPYPDAKQYGVDFMSTEERSAFLSWHKEKENEVFDFKAEMLAYCQSDVCILTQACLKFRELLFNATGTRVEVENENGEREEIVVGGVDPFACCTIASVCSKVFKTKFLEESLVVTLTRDDYMIDVPAKRKNEILSVLYMGEWLSEKELDTKHGLNIFHSQFVKSPIAQVPSNGYVARDQYSHVSIQWLEWVMEKARRCGYGATRNIQHALNGGEYKVPGTNYKLDGYCAETNTAYEYHSCLFHGCQTCYPNERYTTKLPGSKQSLQQLYFLTEKKRKVLCNLGMTYVCKWDHEFQDDLKRIDELKTFVKSLDIQSRLEPRNSFFGGRTNASKLHYKVKPGEQVKYVDFTSLYPSVNKYAKYPVGHPQIISEDFDDINNYFGIAKVKILPPRGLYHPVLPYKSNGKLKFPLCRTCADNESLTPCKCSDSKRAMLGTWCTPELQMAVQKGYIIQKVYEVYHWNETTQYDPSSREGGLFTEYINCFLKIKQEASGWPSWCETDSDKEKYISDYLDREKIKLDPDKIEANPGLRALAKLMLNSFWGKYGQNLDKRQSSILHESEADKFFRTLTNPAHQIHNFVILAEDAIQLEWSPKALFQPEDYKTNIFIATFTTCWARLKLYELLDQLASRVLYYDTDSVIYISRVGEWDPPLGDYLGELTDELGDGFIEEYVSGGPKNYAFRENSGSETCKVRGFSLNFTNSQLINFDAIKDIIISPERGTKRSIEVVNPHKINRAKYDHKLFNRVEKKKYGMVYTKRVIQPDLDTLPYGY